MMFANDDSSIVSWFKPGQTDTKFAERRMISEKFDWTEPEEIVNLKHGGWCHWPSVAHNGNTPEKQFNKLPEIIQQTLGSPQTLVNWGKVDEDRLTRLFSSTSCEHTGKIAENRNTNALPESESMIAGIKDWGLQCC